MLLPILLKLFFALATLRNSEPKPTTIEAMQDSKQLLKDTKSPKYSSKEELKKALDELINVKTITL